MGKGTKNRATARRTASEKKAGKMDRERSPLPSLPAFFRSLSPVRAFHHYLNAWDRLRDGEGWERKRKGELWEGRVCKVQGFRPSITHTYFYTLRTVLGPVVQSRLNGLCQLFLVTL